MSNTEKAKELETIAKSHFGIKSIKCRGCESSYIDGFKDGAQWQSQQPDIKQWVSVLDQTPPFVEFVLCYSPKGGISYRCFSKTHSIYYPQQWIDVLHVTHWQKPQPPNPNHRP